ncbi:MAG: phosphoglycerate kinase [Candidatus Coatesbacteria bacterium]|nr:phosphoglycerate kinase [Candidatus Coatesbacteria bacterium]
MLPALCKKTLVDVDISGKRVLIRVDFNVPLNAEGGIVDDSRIIAHLQTINYALQRNARVILASHLGRPKGKVVPSMSLAPVAKRLKELFPGRVQVAGSCVGPEVEKAVAELEGGEILLLENTRFHPEEEKNDPDFARKLAFLCDVYVADAFSAAHRAHATVAEIAKYVPAAVQGFLMEKEVFHLGRLLDSPQRPFQVVLGGAKVKEKIELIQSLLGKADNIAVGGGMCYTFLKVEGKSIGKSILDEEHLESVTSVLEDAESAGTTLLLPVDVVVATEIKDDAKTSTVSVDSIPDDQKGLDIGPETVKLFRSAIESAATVFWNGPMGVFENPLFAKGTIAIAKALAASKGTTVIGGGETVSAATMAGVVDAMTHVSTGGGASLEFLAGRTLPGIAALDDK